MKKIVKKRQTASKKHNEKKKSKRNSLRAQKKISSKEEKIEKKKEETIQIKTNDKTSNKSEGLKNIKDLIRNIFNVKEARRQLLFLGIDYKNLPKDINKEVFKKCCEILRKIDENINSNTIDHKTKKDIFFELSKEYYQIIPHIFPLPDYNLYLINDIEKIKREICLLEIIKSFSELEKAFNGIKYSKEENGINNKENIHEHHSKISDSFFKKALSEFELTFDYINRNTKEFEEIEKLVNLYSTQSKNKNKTKGPFPPLELLELFRINKESEKFDEKNIKMKNLLWYGCEMIHFYSILKNNSLRLPIKYAPRNAFSYGKGILISDNIYSQIQKCLPINNIVYLFVCSVESLQHCKKVHIEHKEYPKHLSSEFNSVMRVDKIKVSLNEESTDYIHTYSFIYYDPSLIKLEYIAKLKIPSN